MGFELARLELKTSAFTTRPWSWLANFQKSFLNWTQVTNSKFQTCWHTKTWADEFVTVHVKTSFVIWYIGTQNTPIFWWSLCYPRLPVSPLSFLTPPQNRHMNVHTHPLTYGHVNSVFSIYVYLSICIIIHIPFRL